MTRTDGSEYGTKIKLEVIFHGPYFWSHQVKGLFIGLEVRSSIAKIQVVIMVKCLDHEIPCNISWFNCTNLTQKDGGEATLLRHM